MDGVSIRDIIKYTSEINKKVLANNNPNQTEMEDKVIDPNDPKIKAQLDRVKQKLNRRY